MSNQYQPPAKPTQPAAPAKSGAGLIVIVVIIVLVVVLAVVALFGSLVLALLVPAVGAARNAAQEARHINDMRMLGLAYQTHMTMSNEGPQTWDDLLGMDVLDSEIIAKLEERNIVVVWGLTNQQLQRGRVPASRVVMAYPRVTDEENVTVLMADGSVSNMPWSTVQDYLDTWEVEQAARTTAEQPE